MLSHLWNELKKSRLRSYDVTLHCNVYHFYWVSVQETIDNYTKDGGPGVVSFLKFLPWAFALFNLQKKFKNFAIRDLLKPFEAVLSILAL